jgi:hypothetical protein
VLSTIGIAKETGTLKKGGCQWGKRRKKKKNAVKNLRKRRASAVQIALRPKYW